MGSVALAVATTLVRALYRSGQVLLLIAAFLLYLKPLAADPVPVRRTQETFHGFLVLKTPEGRTLATGDLVQVAHEDRVTSRLTFHFGDGSLDDEVAIYTQHKVFQLISDHHFQRGPSFPKPLDMSIDARSGQITSRDDQKITQGHIDLDPDICNGLPLCPITEPRSNRPSDPPFDGGADLQTRLVHIVIAPDGNDSVSIGGIRHKANELPHQD